MAIELITGRGEDNHISANDIRAFNRANFGQGKYILNDADNMSWFVSAPTGEITINAGSLMWSGMHVRNESTTVLNYSVPSSTTKVSIYLHYTKNVSSLYEKVEFVVATGSERSPIIDSLSDDTIEAYTLFGSFFATASMTRDHTNGFKMIKNNEDIEKLVGYAHEETVLFEGKAVVGDTINLSESFRNFRELLFIGRSDNQTTKSIINTAMLLVSQIGSVGEYLGVPLIGADKLDNSSEGLCRTMPWFLQIKSDVAFVCNNTNYSYYYGAGQSGGDPGWIEKIIGIGRKV